MKTTTTKKQTLSPMGSIPIASLPFELEQVNEKNQTRAKVNYLVYIDSVSYHLQVQAICSNPELADGICNNELSSKLKRADVRVSRDKLEFLASYRAMTSFSAQWRFTLDDWEKFTGGRDCMDSQTLIDALAGV